MRISEPKFWWYSNPPFPINCLIFIWSLFLSLIIFFKNFFVKEYSSSIPVVCVGNFVVGGQGKTPFTRLIRRVIESKGLTTGVILRGYGGSNNLTKIINETDLPKEFGDESILHSMDGLTVVSRNRKEAIKILEKTPVNVAILDDGFQNPSIKKDISIVLVDLSKGFGNGSLIPFGPMRESLADGLKRTDLIIFIDSIGEEHISINEIKELWRGPQLTAKYNTVLEDSIKPDVILYSGISNPRKFTKGVADKGFNIIRNFIFHDHEAISEKKARMILDASHKEGADIVTTDKDYARLKNSPKGSYREKLFLESRVAELEIIVDQDFLLEFLAQTINSGVE